MAPHASIIILTKNAGPNFFLTLDAVFASVKYLETEVVVVDSGSADSTLATLSRYPIRLITIPPSSFGHGRTRNLAAEHCLGKFLVFLTQDAIPADKNWIKNLLKGFEDEAVAGIYGRQLPGRDASPIEKFFLSYLYPDKRIVKTSINTADCLLSDMFFSNVNSAVRRSEWEKARFNESIIMSEDQDWSKRILMQGRSIVYEPEAAVIHNHRYTAWSIIQRNFDSGLSLKGIVKAPLKRVLIYELGYITAGALFFLKNKLYAYLLLFPFYEAIRALGFSLGFHSRLLPRFLKVFMSQNKAYWLDK